MKPQKAVWVETGHIAIGTGILTAIMAAVFAIIGRFDWMVLLGASIGFVTAVGNFFFMAYTVQKVTHGLDAEEKDAMKQAKARMKMSYSKRLCAMMVIIGVSIKVLGANWIACMA
ncbi:MAG: ATP synthase subunit I, partial [bacterium]|nr:ATP synthase subunit I [bacterium]